MLIRVSYTKRIVKRCLAATIILLSFCASLQADAWGLSLDTRWYGSIPSAFHDDPLAVRSHLSLDSTFTLLAIDLSPKIELSTDLVCSYVSRSMLYGTTIWREFITFGGGLEITRKLNELYSIAGAAYLMTALYTQTMEMQPILRLSVKGGVQIARSAFHKVLFTVPVSVDIRSDYLSVCAGIGLTWRRTIQPKEDKT